MTPKQMLKNELEKDDVSMFSVSYLLGDQKYMAQAIMIANNLYKLNKVFKENPYIEIKFITTKNYDEEFNKLIDALVKIGYNETTASATISDYLYEKAIQLYDSKSEIIDRKVQYTNDNFGLYSVNAVKEELKCDFEVAHRIVQYCSYLNSVKNNFGSIENMGQKTIGEIMQKIFPMHFNRFTLRTQAKNFVEYIYKK